MIVFLLRLIFFPYQIYLSILAQRAGNIDIAIYELFFAFLLLYLAENVQKERIQRIINMQKAGIKIL